MKEAARPEPAAPAPRAKEAARPDPAAAAQRVKEGVRDLAIGAFGAAGDLASDAVTGYRKSTKWFKLRAYVVGTWVVLGLVTFWAACPPSAGPTNSLGAKAKLLAGSIMGSQVFVENESEDVLWREVVVTLEGGWRYERRTVRPKESFVVPTNRFTKDGTTAPPGLSPKTILIECTDGKVTMPLPVER
ncbi:MAG TPA: hypothetical protein VF875_05005 [Anaeromyxobacter sp.]